MKTKIITLVVALIVLANSTFAATLMPEGRFSERNAQLLNALIVDNGSGSSNYNANKRPYIVCDWDNTSAFGDAEETLTYYVATNFLFRVKPADFIAEISYGVPTGNSKLLDNNNQPINFDNLVSDLMEDYTYLYNNYIATGGRKTLNEIKAMPEHQDFVAKLYVLFDAVDANSYNGGVCDEWQGQLFSGFTTRQLEEISEQSIRNNLASEIRKIPLNSVDSLNRKCKNVRSSTFQGLRIFPDMSNLFQTCMANGIDVYIVSASPEPIIKPIACNPAYGYCVPYDHVFGVKFATKNGYFAPYLAKDRAMTWGPGKEVFIKSAFIQQKGYEPILICGDSDGDYDMLKAFKNTKGLIINRLKSGDIGSLCALAVQQMQSQNPKYLLQGIDQNIGMFDADEATIAYGKTNKQLLKQ